MPVAPAMSAQLAPELLQRRHWRAKVIVGVPVHVPVPPVSVWPSVVVPVTAGRTVLTGGAAVTVALAADVAGVLPTLSVAVTTTLIAEPTSVGVSRYVELVAPAMSAQLAPAASQRRHW